MFNSYLAKCDASLFALSCLLLSSSPPQPSPCVSSAYASFKANEAQCKVSNRIWPFDRARLDITTDCMHDQICHSCWLYRTSREPAHALAQTRPRAENVTPKAAPHVCAQRGLATAHKPPGAREERSPTWLAQPASPARQSDPDPSARPQASDKIERQ